jgi:hypothetical protein
MKIANLKFTVLDLHFLFNGAILLNADVSLLGCNARVQVHMVLQPRKPTSIPSPP